MAPPRRRWTAWLAAMSALAVCLGGATLAGTATVHNGQDSDLSAAASEADSTDAQGGGGNRRGRQVTTWAASDDRAGGSLDNITVRNIVHTSIGGSGVRIRLSNALGNQPVTFGRAFVGLQRSGAELVPGSNRQVTFAGSPSVTVPQGADVLSDPLDWTLPPQQNLAVSLYLSGSSGTITAHNRTMQDTYKSVAGDHAGEDAATSFVTQSAVWFWLDAVVVTAPSSVGTVAALGDSITAGVGSTNNANNRWPDFLARRLTQLPSARQLAVANEGISANRVLAEGTGPNAQARLLRDVLAKPGVDTVILVEGINDIGNGPARSADELIAGYRALIARTHAAGRCIIGGTLTPWQGAISYTEDKDAIRRAVNDFIRTSGEFDGVIDFDRAVRDPSAPNRLTPAYDSGDHLHLSDAGYRAKADAVDLKLLRC